MIGKALFACLLILTVKTSRFSDIELEAVEDVEDVRIKKIQNEILKQQPTPTLTGITPEEKTKLEAFIGKSIVEASSDYTDVVSSKLTFAQLNTYPADIHLIASKVALQFVHHNLNNGKAMASFIKPPRCKIMTEKIPGQKPWKLDHNALLKIEKIFQEFNEIYGKWFNKSPRIIRYRLYNNLALTEEDAENIRKHMLKSQKYFTEFYEKFQAEIQPIIEDYRNGFCNLKNFLHHFQLLPRFFETYKKVPEGFVKTLRFHDLGALMARARGRYKVIFTRIALFDLVLQIINDYYFYLGQTTDFQTDKVSLPFYQDAMLDIIEITAESVKSLCYFKNRFERYYKELKFIIYSLEDAAEIKSLPFPKLKFVCGTFRLIVGFFALIVSLFFV